MRWSLIGEPMNRAQYHLRHRRNSGGLQGVSSGEEREGRYAKMEVNTGFREEITLKLNFE